MIQYMSAREAAEKWNISHRRVTILCAENRIPDVAMLGNMWIIPRDAKKPVDARINRNSSAMKDGARPFVKWAGGKGQLLETLKENLPVGMGKTIRKYAEPFVGGGALLFSLLNEYSFDEIYINDNNGELMNAYAVIKENCAELIDCLRRMQAEYDVLDAAARQAYYYEKRALFNEISLVHDTRTEKAALFLFLNKTCFNGLYRVNRAGKFNVPAGRYANPLLCDSGNLTKISALLQNVLIKTCDYADVASFADEHTLVYFDPPYRPLNATSEFTSYTQEQFTDENQRELAALFCALARRNVKVLLSNSDPKNVDDADNFFDDLYAGFFIQRIPAVRMINSKAEKRGKITELLIKNYE